MGKEVVEFHKDYKENGIFTWEYMRYWSMWGNQRTSEN